MAQTYAQWKAQFAIPETVRDEQAMRETFDWHRKHPHDDDLAYYLDVVTKKHPPGDASFGDKVRAALAPPGKTGYLRRDSSSGAADPTTQAPPTTTVNQASDPAKPSGGADVASKLSAFAQTDPGFGAFLQQNPDLAKQILHPADTGSVSYWQDSGVDPNADVLGTVNYGPNTHNTMSASGLMQHGPEGPMPVTQSADKWLQRLYTMSAPEVLDLQHRLWDQGWYAGSGIADFSQIKGGQPDKATLTAYVSVLAETARYNYAGKRIGIDGVIDLGSPDAATAKKGTGSPTLTTNPSDVHAALRTQAQQELGRYATPAEEAAFTHAYLADEEAARRQMVAGRDEGTNNGVMGPGDLGARAQEFVDTHSIADRIAYGAAQRQQEFYAMLKSPV